MPVQPAISSVLHVSDALELPPLGAPIRGVAERRDVYPIHVTRDSEDALARLRELVGDARVALIADAAVAELHGAALVASLGPRTEMAVVPSGERHKTLDQAARLLDWLTTTQLTRGDAIVTFGGGVVNDMGGWVASAYMRGVGYVNVPTTLVAQVDAGIGGKLAVNHPTAKNLIGGFFQPRGVISNVVYLRSLETRQLRAGLAEAIKKAVIASPAYWRQIVADADAILAGDLDALERLVHGASAIKAELIARDPYERDARRTLGFGHALAHPLETVTGYDSLLHGEAVAFGMAVECRLSASRGLLTVDRLEGVLGLLRRVGLPTTADELPASVDGRALLHAIDRIKLIRGGGFRFVLPLGIGESQIADDVTTAELHGALRASGIEVPR